MNSTTPRWFDRSLRAGLVAFLALAVTGLPLAMAGWFDPRIVGPAVLLVGAGIWRLLPEARHSPTIARVDHVATVIVVVLVAGTTLLNARFASQHLEVDRDPGVYVATAKWLAENGDLTPPGLVGAFADAEDASLRPNGAGFYVGAPDGELYAQFMHLLPVTMAVGQWIAGDAWMLRVPPLLGGLAVLTVFAVAARLLRPRWAALPALGLAWNLVQVHFSRDAFSEVPAQALLFGGLWLLSDAIRDRSPRTAAVAGMLIGATAMTRVDAYLGLLPVCPLAAGLTVWPGSTATRTRWAIAAALVAGTAATAAIGWLDAIWFSPLYLGDLWRRVGPLMRALVATVPITLVIALAAPWALRWARRARSVASRLAPTVAVSVLVLGAALWSVRPAVQTAIKPRSTPPDSGLVAGLQAREGLEVNSWRTYNEATLARLADYVGPVALGAGIVGAAVVVFRLLRRPDDDGTGWIPLLALTAPPMIVYLWAMSITPDQIWALRRYLPHTIPALLILAALPVATLWARGRSHQALAILIAIGTIAFPLRLLVPLHDMRTQVPLLAAIRSGCSRLGPDAAVVLVRDSTAALRLPQTLTAWCGVPTVTGPAGADPAAYRALADAWHADGRSLVLVVGDESQYLNLPGTTVQQLWDVEHELLERTIERRPEEVVPPRSSRMAVRFDPPDA